ncbi:hypothetical protein [Bacillus toyonensis]|uniref:hypothetical protein n=1 Tax=Bacillus toyonensis TaxID=155322 RepID=UPI001CD680B4|nr:hypothetical protein [Bacillus toyonensis]MCA1042937.1 hypothetical protein [Bacillus toyonensis]
MNEKFDFKKFEYYINNLQDMLKNDGIEVLAEKIGMKKSSKYKVGFSNFNCKDLNDVAGIYIFYIKPKKNQKLSNLEEQWANHRDTCTKNKIPKVNASYAEKSNNCMGNVLYLGKSESNLGGRLREHIKKCAKSTYALKLYAFPNRLDYDISYECYYFEKKEDNSAVTQKILLTLIEKNLHTKLNPIIGTSR